jgi:hypothetical protein
MMKKVLIQEEMPQIFTGKTPLRLGWCVPTLGGVPRYQATNLLTDFSAKKQQQKGLWTAYKHTTNVLGKDDFTVLVGILQC